MAKRVNKKPQNSKNDPKGTDKVPPKKPIGTQSVNRDKSGKFVKGNKATTNGFDENPENINKDGSNKGSKWKKSLLKQLMSMPLQEDDLVQFKKLRETFPSFFVGTEEMNYQFFMELKNINLLFSKNDNVSLKAMQEIRDRIDGKSIQRVENKISTDISVDSFLSQFENEE